MIQHHIPVKKLNGINMISIPLHTIYGQVITQFIFISANSLEECLHILKQKDIPTPKNDYEWQGLSRMTIDVRRDHVLSDMLREMKKPRFNTALLLKVFTHFVSLM